MKTELQRIVQNTLYRIVAIRNYCNLYQKYTNIEYEGIYS